MNKRVVLAILGVIAAVAVIWLTTRDGEPGQVEDAVPAASQSSSTPAPLDGTSAPRGNPSQTAATPEMVSAAAPAAAIPDGVLTSQTTGEALPIDVSAGFEYLSKPASEMKDTDFLWPNWRRHQELQEEPRDEAWAPRMEAALRSGIEDSLTARGLDTRRIELPVVECRTTGCEIQAVGYTQDNGKQGMDLQSILPGLLGGSLGDEFDRDSFGISMSPRSDQRIVFLAFLPRKKS
jgi:hypothetical protein